MVSELPFQLSRISLQVITSTVLSIITAVLNGCMVVTCATKIPSFATADSYDDDHDYYDTYDYDYDKDGDAMM